jgi:hypothetical protein
MPSGNLGYLPGAFVCEECEKKHQMRGTKKWSEEVDDGYDADDEDGDGVRRMKMMKTGLIMRERMRKKRMMRLRMKTYRL